MHEEILTKEQIELLPLVGSFSKDFGLVGGTAIALHIGHRESWDFDLFSMKDFDNGNIRKKIIKTHAIERVAVDEANQFTFFINGVKFTFLRYPFHLHFSDNFEGIPLSDLLTLAATKAYTLGRRSKWKDYVDLYFIIKDFHALGQIIKKAKEIFQNEFNENSFRQQLSYFEDMNYDEQIIWRKGFETSEEVIKKTLTKFSLS